MQRVSQPPLPPNQPRQGQNRASQYPTYIPDEEVGHRRNVDMNNVNIRRLTNNLTAPEDVQMSPYDVNFRQPKSYTDDSGYRANPPRHSVYQHSESPANIGSPTRNTIIGQAQIRVESPAVYVNGMENHQYSQAPNGSEYPYDNANISKGGNEEIITDDLLRKSSSMEEKLDDEMNELIKQQSDPISVYQKTPEFIFFIFFLTYFWTLCLTFAPVVFSPSLNENSFISPRDYYKRNGWYTGSDVMRIAEPIGGVILHFFLFFHSKIFREPSTLDMVVIVSFMLGSGVYGQGAGWRGSAIMFKNALETISPPTDDSLGVLHSFMQNVWERIVGNYLYIGKRVRQPFPFFFITRQFDA